MQIGSNRYSLTQVNVYEMSAVAKCHNARGQASKLVSRSGEADLWRNFEQVKRSRNKLRIRT